MILHLAVADEWAARSETGYVPSAFARDGFIHCTDGAGNLLEVANRYYRDDPRSFVVLVIDPARLASEIRYEDPSRIYPHIYGALNPDAVVAVVPAERHTDGRFRAVPV